MNQLKYQFRSENTAVHWFWFDWSCDLLALSFLCVCVKQWWDTDLNIVFLAEDFIRKNVYKLLECNTTQTQNGGNKRNTSLHNKNVIMLHLIVVGLIQSIFR
jgi:hypothetical protein